MHSFVRDILLDGQVEAETCRRRYMKWQMLVVDCVAVGLNAVWSYTIVRTLQNELKVLCYLYCVYCYIHRINQQISKIQ